MAAKKTFIAAAAIATVVCAVSAAVLTAAIGHSAALLSSQQTAARWGNGEKYEQLSAFFSSDADISRDSIYSFEAAINKGLDNNSIIAKSEDARLWIDCYSTECDFSASPERDNVSVNADVTAVCTGGDYFLFHPLKLKTGNYYQPDALLQDQIVIDANLAWKLYGSSDIAGKTVMIKGSRFYIAGVAEEMQKKSEKEIIGTTDYIYMSYYAAKQLMSDDMPKITSYEACIPNPVKGVAANIFKDSVKPSDDKSFVIVDNTERLSYIGLAKQFLKRYEMTVIDKTIAYPFWENIARTEIYKLSGFIAPLGALIVFLFIMALYWLRQLYKAIKSGIIAVKNKISDRIDKENYRRYMEKQNNIKSKSG